MNFKLLLHNERVKKYGVLFVFILYLFIGLNVFDDYGVGTDNNTHRVISTYNLLTAAEHITGWVHADSAKEKLGKEIIKFNPRYIGHPCGESFGVPLVMLEALFFGIHKNPSKEIYEFRHLMTFLFCYMGVVFFYFLIKNISGRRSVALLTTLLLMLSPRIFTDFFYNQQDTVFLTACIMGMFFYVRFLKEKTLKNGILLGFFAAYATGIRFLGVQFIMLALFFICLGFIKERKINSTVLKSALGIVLVYIIFTIFHYPVSWGSPGSFFFKLLGTISRFPHESTQLFMGQWIDDQNLPWFYLAVWMLITIPLLYILMFLYGLYCSVRKLFQVKEIRAFSVDYQILLSAIIMFFIPILGIMIKGSPLYNGWRHLYFLYLPFLVIVSYSISAILSRLNNVSKKTVVFSFFGAYLLSVAVWMFINHPYQYVFFNAIPQNIESRYEKDYWGTSMIDGMKYILNVDPSEKIVVKRSRGSAKQSRNMLDKESQKRIEVMPDDSATPDNFNYFLYNGDDYETKDYAKEHNLSEVHSIKVYNSIYTQKYKIMSIYKK